MRGMKYSRRAIVIWEKRLLKLVTAFGRTDEHDEARKTRIKKLIDVLQDRMKCLLALKLLASREQAISDREGQNNIVHLECENFDCKYNPDGIRMGIRLADYEEGKYRCSKCGLILRPVEERGINAMLSERGIQRSL